MKKILLILALALISTFTFSQNPFPKGRNQLNFGVGLSGWGVPLYIGIDHGVGKDFSIGGEFSYRDYRENWKDAYYDHNIMGFLGNANYHFNRILELPDDWDIYGGLNLGFFVWSSPDNYTGNENSGLDLGAQIGVRYYISNKVGLNLEMNSGNSITGGKFGVTIRI